MTPRLSDTDLVLVRHAPVAEPGRLFGRTDAEARIPQGTDFEELRAFLTYARTRVSSPAFRCRQTSSAIWGEDTVLETYPELWEQDFGDWEGLPLKDLPDIGEMAGGELAALRPPNGESFDDLCARAAPRLRSLADSGAGPTVAVVHAGIVRAGLSIAIGVTAPALKFDVAPLSVTRFAATTSGEFVVREVNVKFVDL